MNPVKLKKGASVLINIGPSKEPSDIVDMLLECHERIHLFVGLARQLAESKHAPKEQVQDAAARIRRYFSEALPMHVADEEKSIQPRLCGRRPEPDNALEAMLQEHRSHESLVEELVQACGVLEAFPDLLSEKREGLGRVVAGLERDFGAHLQEEEAVVLPAIRSLLTDEERQAMLEEFRARRGKHHAPRDTEVT